MKMSVVPMLDYGGTNTTLGPVFLFRVKTFFSFHEAKESEFSVIFSKNCKNPK